MIINNTNSTNHYARSENDSDIEIFTDVIKEITSGTYKSYTMYIKTSDTIASRFYNLTLEEKEGNTDAFFTKYSPTENWLNDKNQPFEGDIRTFRVIEPGPGGSIKFTHIGEDVSGGSSYPFDCDGYVQTSIVLEPYQCGCGPEHWPWQTCECTTSHPPGYTPHLYYECIPNDFGNPGTGNPGSGYSPGGGSNSSTHPNDPSNNSLTTIVGEPIIRPSVLYLADLLSLNGRQIAFLSNNPVIEGQISNYISENMDSNNVVNPEAMAFALELIDSALEGTLISSKPFFKYPPNSNYATLYPSFTSLVKDYMEYLRNDNNLINTISDLTGQSNSTIIKHLTWGRGAEINVVQLGNAPDGTQYKGMFNPLYPDKIFIDIDLVQYLENLTNQNGENDSQVQLLNGLIVFSVCLHELVHFEDFNIDGLMQGDNDEDLGELFEAIYQGGYFEFDENHDVVFIKAN